MPEKLDSESVAQKPWTLHDALEFWKYAEVQLGRNGFLCGIYGSVLRGEGRDLDLLIIPKRINTSIDIAVEQLAESNGGELSEPYRGIMGTVAFTIKLPSGRILDLQFYKPQSPRDAEELFLQMSRAVEEVR